MVDILVPMTPVIDAFEELGITYYIGGSVASSNYGFPRTTIDADIVADLRMEHVTPLVEKLKDDFYVDTDMIMDAVRHRSEFNVIHYKTTIKVDVFLPKTRPYDQEALRRVQQDTLDEGGVAIQRFTLQVGVPALLCTIRSVLHCQPG